MTFDPKKPVQTRDGRYARIICTDAQGEYSANANGPRYDLINVPERKTWWANVYDDGFSRTFCSRRFAVDARGHRALGLASLTIEDGKIIAFENHPLDGGGDE